MKRVLDEIPAGACLADADGWVTAANEALATLVGTDPRSVRGTPLAELATDEQLRELFEAALDGDHAVSGACELATPGRAVTREVECIPLDGGEPAAVLVVVGGDRVAATPDTRAGQWAELLDTFPLPTLTLRPDGSVASWNPAAERLLGWTESDVLGARPPFLGHAAEQQWSLVREQVRRDETVTDAELQVRSADGTLRHVTVSAVGLADDRMLVVVRDLTAPREQAEQLELLDRVLRHNIRNDMNVVMGHAERLADAVDEPELVTSVEAVLERSADIVDLSDKAREFTAVIKGEHDLVAVDLAAAVRRQVEACRAENPGVSFEVDVAADARANALRSIETAVGNLLENAVEHNDADDPRVAVEVANVNVDGRESVEVTVRDNGPGIPAGEREVFIEGREDHLNHGSGLGLWLVYWIVQRSNGELLFSRNEPRGSVLVIRLERARDFSF